MLSFCSKIHGVHCADMELGLFRACAPGHWASCHGPEPSGALKSTQATRQGHNCLLAAFNGALAGLQGNMVLIKTRSSHQNIEFPALGALAGTPASLHWRAVLRGP